MGISDKMGELAGRFQDGVKTSSVSLVAWVLKFFTSFMLGLTFALITQEIMGFGSFSFSLLFLVMLFASLKLISKWSLGLVLIFDLVCVLVALLLRMYILIAP